MIHPSAVISKKAKIHDTTNIGPFCIIGDEVVIGKNNNLISNTLYLSEVGYRSLCGMVKSDTRDEKKKNEKPGM